MRGSSTARWLGALAVVAGVPAAAIAAPVATSAARVLVCPDAHSRVLASPAVSDLPLRANVAGVRTGGAARAATRARADAATLCALGLLSGPECGLHSQHEGRDPTPPLDPPPQTRSCLAGNRPLPPPAVRIAPAQSALAGSACHAHARGVFRPPRC